MSALEKSRKTYEDLVDAIIEALSVRTYTTIEEISRKTGFSWKTIWRWLKLIRHIRTFESKRIIVDIGTGASYNCIDFFLLSNPGILVINPEPTSIENAYYFLKSCILRLLKMYINHYQIQDLVKKVAEQIQDTSRSIYSFLSEIISQDKQYADLLFRALKRFRPCLIVNKARTDKDRMLGHSIVNVVQKYLVIDLDFLGSVPMDESVHTSLQSRKPYIHMNPDSDVSAALRDIAEKLTEITRLQGTGT